MTRNEKIISATAIIGLIADLITITGLLSGFVIPKPDVHLLLSKKALAIISMAFLFYFEAIMIILVVKFYETRIKLKGFSQSDRESKRDGLIVLTISYALWSPSYLLWLLWVFENWHAFFLFIVGLFGVLIGGFLIMLLGLSIYEILYPYEDIELNKKSPINSIKANT